MLIMSRWVMYRWYSADTICDGTGGTSSSGSEDKVFDVTKALKQMAVRNNG